MNYVTGLIVGVVFIAIIGLGIGAILVFANGVHYETSKGAHTGFITAVETNGIIFKTHSAYIKTDVSSSQEEQYCVIDDAVKAELEEKSQSSEKVTIEFVDYFIRGFTNCSSVVDEIGVITGVK